MGLDYPLEVRAALIPAQTRWAYAVAPSRSDIVARHVALEAPLDGRVQSLVIRVTLLFDLPQNLRLGSGALAAGRRPAKAQATAAVETALIPTPGFFAEVFKLVLS